jgi:hypothetical protein
VRLWRTLAEAETTGAKQEAPDQGGRAACLTKPRSTEVFLHERGEVGSSRAANTQGTIDLFRRSTEEHTRLRKPSGSCRTRTRSLPPAPEADQTNRRIRHFADTKTT